MLPAELPVATICQQKYPCCECREHRHESGLHVIGGERRLIHRLVEFFEQGAKLDEKQPASDLDN